MRRVPIETALLSRLFLSLITAGALTVAPTSPPPARAANAAELTKQADALFDEQKWDKAQRKYEGLAKYSRDDERSYAQYRTGLCLSKLGKYPDALKIWEKLFALDTCTEWSARAMEDAGELSITQLDEKQKGIKLYERLLQKFPKYTNRDAIFHKLAMQHFNDSNYSQALPTFQRLLTEYPKSTHADSARQYAMLCDERLKTPGQARPTAKTEIAVADKLYQMGDYQQARRKYEQIARDYRPTEEAQYAGYRVGLCLFQQERYKDALKAWDDFLKGAPKNPYSQDALARTAKTYAFCLNDIREGLKRYQELARKYPQALASAQLQYELAGAYYTQRNWEEAKRYFERLLKEHPACNVAPTAKEYLSRCDEALHGRKPKKQEPLSPLQALKRRADLFYASQRYKEAAELYQKLAISCPDTPDGQEAQFKAGLSLYKAGEFPSAIDTWRYFQAFAPGSPWADDALEGIGNIQLDTRRDITDGISTYEKLLHKYPQSEIAPRVLHRIAMIQFESGEFQKAEDAFSRELALYPQCETANIARAFLDKKQEIIKSQLGPAASAQLARLMTAGDLFYESREYQRAETRYAEIIKRWPSREQGQYALYQLGNCQHFQWRPEEAIKTWQELLATYPKSKWADDALLMMGTAYVGPLRNRNKGEDCFRKLVQAYPKGSDAPLAQHYIGVLYLWDGRLEQALKEFGQELALYPQTEFSDQTKRIVKAIHGGTYKGVHPSR